MRYFFKVNFIHFSKAVPCFKIRIIAVVTIQEASEIYRAIYELEVS